MIVPDSSAWIEYLRAAGTPLDTAVQRMLEERQPIGVTEVVVMEVLAGVRTEVDLTRTRRQLLGFTMLRLGGLEAFEEAAAIFRACRRAGETVRRLSDCMIAVPVIAAGASILHRDRDFDVIARHTDLRVEPVEAS